MPKGHEKEWKNMVEAIKRGGQSDSSAYAIATSQIKKKYNLKKKKKGKPSKNPFKDLRY